MNTFTGWAAGRNILILLLLFLLMNLVVIPAFYPRFQTLDTLASYTPQQAYQLISSYGDRGRESYLIAELTLDLVYPLILALLFSFAALYTFQRAFPKHPWTHNLALLPFLVMLADYLENLCVVIMLASFPSALPFVATLSNVFTVAKFVLTPLELLFVVGLIAWFIHYLRRRQAISPVN